VVVEPSAGKHTPSVALVNRAKGIDMRWATIKRWVNVLVAAGVVVGMSAVAMSYADGKYTSQHDVTNTFSTIESLINTSSMQASDADIKTFTEDVCRDSAIERFFSSKSIAASSELESQYFNSSIVTPPVSFEFSLLPNSDAVPQSAIAIRSQPPQSDISDPSYASLGQYSNVSSVVAADDAKIVAADDDDVVWYDFPENVPQNPSGLSRPDIRWSGKQIRSQARSRASSLPPIAPAEPIADATKSGKKVIKGPEAFKWHLY
jgi:hypothetical protein